MEALFLCRGKKLLLLGGAEIQFGIWFPWNCLSVGCWLEVPQVTVYDTPNKNSYSNTTGLDWEFLPGGSGTSSSQGDSLEAWMQLLLEQPQVCDISQHPYSGAAQHSVLPKAILVGPAVRGFSSLVLSSLRCAHATVGWQMSCLLCFSCPFPNRQHVQWGRPA